MNVTTEKKRIKKTNKKPTKCVSVCLDCKNVHYKNIWYAPDSRLALLLDEKKDTIRYRLCPACEMEKEGHYEGVLYIKNIPSDLYDHVISAVLHEAVKDYVENPQHRLLDFYDTEDGYKVTTTAATMVCRIGEKLKSEFSPCVMHSAYQHEPFSMQVTKLTFLN